MRVELVVEVGRHVGRRYVIRMAQTFDLGRHPDCAIRLDDRRVSRHHAAVEVRREGPLVHDLGSRNGTRLDGEPVLPGESRPLRDMAALEVGNHVFRVSVDGVSEAARDGTQRYELTDDQVLPPDEFEVLGPLGEGGMGKVFAVRQRLLKRDVAVKVLREELWANEVERGRFLREARANQRIRSPHVVEVYDVRLNMGRAYMVMELVQGQNAEDLASGGPVPVPEALEIAEHVARALAAAAEQDVIHRDVKPTNVLLCRSGLAKLSDFGIAKDLRSGTGLTRVGLGLGSLPYAAPEQVVDARSVDPRTDLYGLGATLYHLLAGRPPFDTSSDAAMVELLSRIDSAEPTPLTEVRDDCPPQVERLVRSLMAKTPEDRPPGAAWVAAWLRDFRERWFPGERDGGDGLLESQEDAVT